MQSNCPGFVYNSKDIAIMKVVAEHVLFQFVNQKERMLQYFAESTFYIFTLQNKTCTLYLSGM